MKNYQAYNFGVDSAGYVLSDGKPASLISFDEAEAYFPDYEEARDESDVFDFLEGFNREMDEALQNTESE